MRSGLCTLQFSAWNKPGSNTLGYALKASLIYISGLIAYPDLNVRFH
jgi:hypothetical protein